MALIKKNFQYNQNSVQLNIEGLPDISLGQSPDSIGILSNWQLQLVGSPLLEGKKEHLESLMSAIHQYARHSISGIKKTFGDSNKQVTISPSGDLHKLCLKSSKEAIEPLEIKLDDAELSDLVRCLDDLYHDNRVLIIWKVPINKPLASSEIAEKIPILQRITPPTLGLMSFIFIGTVFLFIPIPELLEPTSNPLEITGSQKDNIQ